ncbi:phosphatidylinositol kinase [Escherichia coli]|nr:phosphatidylinositol kinase [Escherichia coli]QMC85118.1 phosphatidylinositol kinase [Escherichia coli]
MGRDSVGAVTLLPETSLPTDFPENVVTAVETNVLRLHGRLSREYGSK